jgi:hypothetical protein
MQSRTNREIFQAYIEARKIAKPKPITFHDDFEPQNQFILDNNRFLVAQCSRRAGKSNGLAIRFFRTMDSHPKSRSVYLSLTRESAFEIMWPALIDIDERFKLGCTFTESKLLITHPNGSQLKLFGADQKNFAKRLKGKKHPAIAIDEAQDFGSHLQSLVDDVLTPCMTDYADGWFALTGTPGPIPAGYWYDISHERKYGFSWHGWTLLDNPYLPNPEAFIEDLKQRREWTDSNPTLLREWRNQWVLDLESLWIRYVKEKCDYVCLPDANWNYILGVDLGYEDADALAVLAYCDVSPTTYLIDEVVIPHQGLTELVREINKLRDKYEICKIVCDEGGLGKKMAEEIRRQHRIPIHAADKKRKNETVTFLNDAMRKGYFKAKAASRFARESQNIQIDKEKTTEDKYKLKGPHSDIIDAVIYAFKESPAYAWEAPKPVVQVGTKAWAKKEEADMFERALEKAQYEKSMAGDPWEDDWKM